MPYCANCGKMVDDEDLYCLKCGAALKQGGGELATEPISIGYPEAENPELEISVAVAGYIKAEPGGEKLIEGTTEYSTIDPDAAPWSSRKFPELYATEEIGMQLELFYKRREPKWVYDPASDHWIPFHMGKA